MNGVSVDMTAYETPSKRQRREKAPVKTVLTQPQFSRTPPPPAVLPARETRPYGRRTGETDKRKQSLYFPEEMLAEIQVEADRQDRSLSWIVQQAWRIARGEILRFPSVDDVLAGR